MSLYPLLKYCFVVLLFSFVGKAWAQPTFTSVPANNATGVSQSADIVLTFNEAIRDGDPGNADLDDSNIDSHITLKLTNSGGSDIPFDATIDAANLIVTINPTGNLPSEAVIYVAIGKVENTSNLMITPDPTSFTFTVIDYVAPVPTFNPLNAAVNVAVNSNIIISFNENILNASGAALDAAAIESGVVELKVTNNAGAAVPFTATFNGTNQITIDPNADLINNTTYYVELNPIEDALGNETTSTSISFTTPDTVAPTITFNPLNNATGVVETTNITITFDEPVRLINNSTITGPDISTLVELRLTDGSGALIPFSGSINGGNTVITINPTSTLAGNTVYYVEINPVEDFNNNATVATSITFTTGDTLPPSMIFSPAGGSVNASIIGNITITFSEPIRKTDGTALTSLDIEGGVVELKETNNAGTVVTFTAALSGGNTIITLNPTVNLLPNQVYYVEVNPIEDNIGNESTSQNITFTTENIPNISGFSNSGTRCIGDELTINGARFTGSGGIGNTKPVVTMEGVVVPPVNITAYTSASITLTIPPGVPTGSNTTVIVVNQDNLLSSDGSDDLNNLYDAINTGLTVTPETLNPAQNSDVDIFVEGTQSSSYSYHLILNSGPAGYSAGSESATGTNGQIKLTTTPILDEIGDYSYRIDVKRSGCTDRTLDYNPIVLTVADLTVTATATNTTICDGITTRLIGAASGGTGFYQFSWTSNPPGFSSGSSSPTVTPSTTTTYFLTVTDNQGNDDQSSVVITVNDAITADIIPAPGQSTVQTNYNIENTNFQLYGDSVGVFSGPGVVFSGGFYYFNPLNAGIGSHLITFTKTNVKGCSATDQETFIVKTSAISGLNLSYCQNQASDSPLAPNSYSYGSYQFTRLVLWNYNWATKTSCITDIAPSFTYCGTANPLTVNSYQLVPDIQAGVSKPLGSLFSQPASYTLDLNMIRTNFGYSAVGFSPVTDYNFYILIYVKDNLGNEYFWDAQKFDVLRNDPSPTISGIKEGEAICSDLTPINLSSSEAAYAVTGFSITPAQFDPAVNSGTGVFDPGHASLAGADSRKLTVEMDYSDKNNCPNTVSTNFIWVKKPLAPIAEDTTYCAYTGLGTKPAYLIKASANGEAETFLWYEFDPIANPSTPVIASGPLFSPSNIDGETAITDQFYVVQSNFGCKGDFNEVSIEILPAPSAIFTNSNICEDRDFTLTGPKDGGTPYPLYVWNFGDTNIDSVANNNLNTYNYGPGTALKPYTISLIVENLDKCKNEFSKIITVGENPKPAFSVNFVCDGDNTTFTASSVPASSEYSWDFDDGTMIPRTSAGNAAPEGGTIQNPIHKFTGGPDEYNVTVTSYTASGCSNPTSKKINILHFLTKDTDDPYLMANVDGGKGYWRLEDVNGNSTWEFAQPTTTMMQAFTSPAWVTNADGFYSANEKSYLNSPCLNIANIERPILSMDLILDIEKNIEGAVLEYSKNGIDWFPLGAENSGLNWFNTTGFRIGNIGSSPVGWSGKSSEDLNDNTEKDILVQARRALDNLANLSQPERSKVRFRIAFATDNKNEFEGFGFNNFSISTRDRISLLEMFTNTNAATYTTNNNVFKAIAIDEIAKIQYHVTYPGDDANASVNKVDPAARAAYYGIPMNDQYIPRSYVDGYSEGTLIDGNWAITEFNKQSLQNAQYNIKIDSMMPDDNSYLKMKVTVEAKVDIPATRNHVLHIAVVEKVVGANEYILRKLVPDVNGHVLPALNQTDTKVVIDSVQLEKSFVNVNNLAIVAFVQDVNSREIFQAAIELDPGYLPVLVTGVETLLAEQISVYPNPASKQFRVELPTPAIHDVNIQLIDQVGRKHDGGFIRSGMQSAAVNVEHLSEGVYILEIGSSESIIRKKVMVVMKN
jgi:hypothetical protein